MKQRILARFARRAVTIGAAAMLTTTGVVALGQPAFAAYDNCPNNHLCLWSGTNGGGTMLFDGDGSEMYDYPTYYTSPALRNNPHALSSNNRTLGKFCTYNSNKAATNILNPQTGGNLASSDTVWVKIC